MSSDSTQEASPSDRSVCTCGTKSVSTCSEGPSVSGASRSGSGTGRAHNTDRRGLSNSDSPRQNHPASAAGIRSSPSATLRGGGAAGSSPPWKTRLEELLLEVPRERSRLTHSTSAAPVQKEVEVQTPSHNDCVATVAEARRCVQDAQVQTVLENIAKEEETESQASAKSSGDACSEQQPPPQDAVTLVSEGASASDVSRGRPRSRPPPPVKRPPSRAASLGANRGVPDWTGLKPGPEWRPERVVNWQPIRQVARFEGSVWQQVMEGAKLGPATLSEQTLQSSFMRKGSNGNSMRRSRSASQLPAARCLSQNQALAADLAHAQLQRLGVSAASQLEWVLGSSGDGATAGGADTVEEELSQDVLETLMNLLRAATVEEDALLEAFGSPAGATLAPSEGFLKQLFKVGPLPLLRARVEMALGMARFKERLHSLATDADLGINSSRRILNSRALPILLHGVLELGNYVNGHSKALGNAVCVTLESLPKLAHTRCLSGGDGGGGRLRSSGGAETALQLLVRQLIVSRPSFLDQLLLDLELCKRAKDLDRKALGQALQDMKEEIQGIEAFLGAISDQNEADVPVALRKGRVQAFLGSACPALTAVEEQFRDLDANAEKLGRWLAETPGMPLSTMMSHLAALCDGLPQASPKGSSVDEVQAAHDMMQWGVDGR
eukprot:CAMPEP_0178391686 /NCGR_PEP_ID=MMETSP0689_2-20121128/11292_1 /TAXON_ID=160604 /ORGANISM="Amphidinium massartii, Strain CS-259" /LENGTH=666 /DNA_ID=CAMNT_0020012239 /DNA_START=395 /DNA_END=2399 /DNA_ORIENTATION=-